jgi:hypothetical protein
MRASGTAGYTNITGSSQALSNNNWRDRSTTPPTTSQSRTLNPQDAKVGLLALFEFSEVPAK